MIDVEDKDLNGGAQSGLVFDGAQRFSRRADPCRRTVYRVQLIGYFDEDLVPAAAAQAVVRAGLAVTGHFLLYRLYSSRPIRHKRKKKQNEKHTV